ncbi:hypothetical protein PORY_000129 [Pneumocystis oryctolagi]|uniref:Uncharacterized protein n=1 Tax=Pneumocystis oryctolagi TaxID=42067 RepID=A0ACB7CEP3_9ASCO|nr:hypothetical protein PORY_000129 [Pneumocystis oryctolagi]
MNLVEKDETKLKEVKSNRTKNIAKNKSEKKHDNSNLSDKKSKKTSVFSEDLKNNKNHELDNTESISLKKNLQTHSEKENTLDLNDSEKTESLCFSNTDKTPTSSTGFTEDSVNEKSLSHIESHSLTSLSSPNSSYLNYFQDSSTLVDIKSYEKKDLFNVEDAIRWCKLEKINSKIFTESTIKKYGLPVSIYVSSIIAVGTSKGLILIFDYRQVLKDVIGLGAETIDFGPVTSMSISNDSMFVCSGHSRGHIFIWELRTPANLVATISPVPANGINNTLNSGHLNNSKICHVAFVNSCHSIVSSDNHGMTFYHILNRNIISNSVLSIRLTGHHLTNSSSNYKKSNAILALASLSMSDFESPANSTSLVAILTLHKLSIITTTPIKSQFKASRPKLLKFDKYISGALSWFSSEKFKKKDLENINMNKNKIRLLYSWKNFLFSLEILRNPTSLSNNKDTSLLFKEICEWKEEENVLATQWFNMNVVVLFLESRKIRIMNIETMESFFFCDISTKKIQILKYFDDDLNEDKLTDDCQENVRIADMFSQSFFIFRKKFFLLCEDCLYVGILPTWDYKLSLILSEKEFVKAVSLMNLYYKGNCEKTILELPLDDNLRHELLREKLLKTINTSLKEVLYLDSVDSQNNVVFDKQTKKDLATACIEACINMKMIDFLFDNIYHQFQKAEEEEVFIESLEAFILTLELKTIPPDIMRSVITIFLKKKMYLNLENIIFKIDLMSLDIDETLKICRKEKLYDILIYIWTQAFNDFITPIIHFLKLITFFLKIQKNIEIDQDQENDLFPQNVDTLNFEIDKLFLYLSNSLLGRIYPTGLNMDKNVSISAKSSIYWFIFLGESIVWPKNNGELIKLAVNNSKEHTFPYLRLILNYDSPAFLSVLDEAFKDDFLNEIDDTSEFSKLSDIKITRQLIVNILLEIMEENIYSESRIHLYIFIAYNIPKYPQFIFLSGSVLEKILIELSKNSNEDLSYKCQTSIKHLLSVYKPNDSNYLIGLYKKTKLYKVLKFIYRQEKMFSELLKVHIEDKDNPDELFQCIIELSQLKNHIEDKKTLDINKIIFNHSEEICSIDVIRFSQVINEYLPELHVEIVKNLKEPIMQYNYLKVLLDPQFSVNLESTASESGLAILNNRFDNNSWITGEIQELFIGFLCSFEKEKVIDYIKNLNINNINIDNVLSILEKHKMTDSIIHLLRLDKKNVPAFEKNLEYISELMLEIDVLLKLEFEKCIEDLDISNFDTIRKKLENAEKSIVIGISLFEEYFFELDSKKCKNIQTSQDLIDSSTLIRKFQWIKLLKIILEASQAILLKLSDQLLNISQNSSFCNLNKNKLVSEISNILKKVEIFIQNSVQNIFISLYNLTSLSNFQSIIFFNILQLLEITVLFPSVLKIKELLIDIFRNYKYDQKFLLIINELLNRDLFKLLERDQQIRRRGCKVECINCGICKKDFLGLKNSMDFLYSWKKKSKNDEILDKKKGENILFSDQKKIQEKSYMEYDLQYLKKSKDSSVKNNSLPKVVIFICGHNYHKDCLYNIQMKKKEKFTCILCEKLTLQQKNEHLY